MSNYTPIFTEPTSFKINNYNITCIDDMGHFNYFDQDDKTKILPEVIHNFMLKILKKYINTKYETVDGIIICTNSLKPELKKKFKYTFTHNNEIYLINMTYRL
jgi:hypothetical protein